MAPFKSKKQPTIIKKFYWRKKMKKFYQRLFAMFLALVLLLPTSVGFAKDDSDSDVFRVGMEVNYAPFNFAQVNDANGAVPVVNSENEYANGYDVQIAKLIADKLGKKLEIYKIEWDGLPPALTSGKIDAIIAGMSPTAERKKEIDFTRQLLCFRPCCSFEKRLSKYKDAKALEDFKGAKITGQLNTFHYTVIDQIEGVDKQSAMESFPSMISATKAGKIDGYVSEKPGAMAAVSANSDLDYVEFEQGKGFETSSEDTSIAVGLRKESSELREEINAILADMTVEEEDEIMNQWYNFQKTTAKKQAFGDQMSNIRSEYATLFLSGIRNTLFIAIFATIVGFIIGLLVAVIRKAQVNKKRIK
jgi:putative lysine transport system permease protein